MTVDLLPFVNRLHIVTKDLRVEPLGRVMNYAQHEIVQTVNDAMNDRRRCRFIVLKARQLGCCLDPATRVLTADLRWEPIGSLRAGDKVVATDENVPGGRGVGRKMRTATVERVFDTYASAIRLTLDDGRVLTGTAEHRWLARVRGAKHTTWREMGAMRVGDAIRHITHPWSEDRVYEDGWMGGLIDGEGCLRIKHNGGVELSVSQVEGAVLNRGMDYFKDRGYPMRIEVDHREAGDASKMGSKPVHKMMLNQMGYLFRAIGTTRPSRFLYDWWSGKDLPGRRTAQTWATVISIEHLPPQRMVDLQTSTGTYIAEGIVSHNSTVIEALMFAWAFYFQNMSGLVISHEADSAKHLLRMTNHYWETWPFKELYTIRHAAVNHLAWQETSSNIRIATAKNTGAGRSQTIQFCHSSETAFYPDPLTMFTGLAQSIPQGYPSVLCKESTANGIGGHFYEEWNAAVDGETDYVPLFFPWHKHPQYTAAHVQIGSTLGELDDEERVLHALGIDDDRLAWRRWAIKSLCNGDLLTFHQEYPTTPEEAFISSGTNIFPDAELSACYRPMAGLSGYLVEERGQVRFQPSLNGPLTIFRQPGLDRDQHKYMISGDATRSITGDFSCAQVLNRRTWEQVAVYHHKIDPVSFGDQMALLGRYYNWAILCPEIQGAGDSTIARLISLNYPFLFEHRKAEKIPGQPETVYGWWSGVRAKQEAIGNLLRAVIDGATPARGIVIHHHHTYNEMRAYVSDDKGGFKNGANEKHDDTVTALAIAITCVMYEAANIDAALGVYGGGDAMGQARAVNDAMANAGWGGRVAPRTTGPRLVMPGDDVVDEGMDVGNGGGYVGEPRPWEIAEGSDEWEERMRTAEGW